MFVHFTQDESRQMRYRIDVAKVNKITSEQKETYVERGWNYITSYGKFNVFSSPLEVNAPELYTDTKEQAYSLEHLDKSLIRVAILMPFLILLMIGLVIFVLLIDWTPYINLVRGTIVQQITALIVALWQGYSSLQAAVSIHNVRRTLWEGKPIDHSAPWERKHKMNLMVSNIITTIAVFGALLPMIQLATMKTETLPIDNSDLPIVRLADVEQNANLARNTHMMKYMTEQVDWANHYSYNWSILSPLQYESMEEGVVANEMWRDENREYSPSISTKLYKLNFASMNEGLLSDMIKRNSKIYNYGQYIEIAHTGFDKLIIYKDDYTKAVYAYKGKGVIYIKYHGNADMDSVIGAAAEKISLISE